MTRLSLMRKPLLTLGIATLILSSCGSLMSTSRSTWTVGSDLANPPFAWVDEAGVPQGRDVEMAKLLAYSMDVDLVWSRMDFAHRSRRA